MQEAEILREALIDLERAREREQALRLQAEALLEGLRALTFSPTPEAMFANLMEALRKGLAFEEAAILIPSEEGKLRVAATTLPQWRDCILPIDPIFQRVLQGQPIAIFDAAQVKEWKESALCKEGCSVLLVPLQGMEQVAVFMGIHSKRGFFGQLHLEIACRFAPLAAEALHHWELQQRLLERDRFFSLSLEMMAIVDFDLRFRQVNRLWEEASGFTQEEVVGQSFCLWVHPEDDEAVCALLGSLQRGDEETVSFEARCRCREGPWRWIHWRAAAYREEGLFYLIGRDITARKQAEERLAAHQRMLEKVVQAGRAITQTRDLHSCLLTIRESALRDFGFDRAAIWLYDAEREVFQGTYGTSREGTLTDEWAATISWEASRVMRVALSEPMGFLHTPDYQATFSPSPGSIMEGVKDHLIVSMWAGEKPVGVLCVDNLLSGRPITEEQIEGLRLFGGYAGVAIENARLLERIHQQAQQLERIVEAVGEGMALLDAERRLLLANRVAREHLALLGGEGKVEHLGGRPLEAFLEPPPEGLLHHEVAVKEPEERLFEVEVWPLADGGGSLQGYVVVSRDVTQQRRLEEQMAIQQRLAAVGQLAAGIAHDFNNALQAIIGFAELLMEREDLPQDVHQQLQFIYQQGDRAAQMIRQILDFSRRSISRQKVVELTPVIKEAFKLFRRTIPESIHMELVIEPGEYWVRADLTQIQQVLANLVVNARDAMPQGGRLEIRMSLRTFAPQEPRPFAHMAPGTWVALSVADTGTGIPREILPRIFEPFFTTKHPSQGTGLGLAQVYGIVKQHGGFIDVETEEGKGSIFTVYLPTAEEAKSEEKEEGPMVRPGRGEKILLVEDEEAVLETGRRLLESLGYQVLTARNGREALEIYDSQGSEIALVLTDMVMPEMGGLQLVEGLRQRGSPVKVVVMSGYPLEEGWERIWGHQVAAWVQKPLSRLRLGEVLEKALSSEEKAEQ